MSLADRTPPTPEEYAGFRERFSNWGRWGDDDQLGTINHITTEVTRTAASLVREGRTVSLSRPFATAAVDKSPFNGTPAEHRLTLHGPVACTDYIGVSYHGYVNTHIDALCHVYGEKGIMYNNRASLDDVKEDGARSNSVEHWRHGIVTRGVLYDVARHRDVPHVTVEEPVHGWELLDIAKAQGIEPRTGDAVLVHSGRAAFEKANPDANNPLALPGNHASVIEFLYEYDASILGWDLMEAPQPEYKTPIGPIHCFALPYMGIALLDNANLTDVASTCAELGRWEFQLVIAPLVVIGGTGSPVNPIAVF